MVLKLGKPKNSTKIWASARLHDKQVETDLTFYINYCIRCRLLAIDYTMADDRLCSYIKELKEQGYDTMKLNKVIGRITNGIKFGFEVMRVVRKMKP